MQLKYVICTCLMLLLVSITAAQDSTPEATPLEVTSEPTIVLTPEATQLAPTAESTVEATSEATAEATPAVRFKVAGTYTVRQPVGELRRQYTVHVPAKYFETEAPAPLVMILHGAGGTGRGIESYTGFDTLSDKEGFIVAYPDAISGAWNDNRGDEVQTVDDLGYLAHLIDSVADKANIDRTRVYAAGYSRGGMMSYRLGCVLPTQFAAVASVASTFPRYLLAECQNAPPKAVMVIQGTDDPIIPWMDIQRVYLSAADTLRFWGQHNRCKNLGPIREAVDLSPLDGTRLLTQDALQCKQPILLYSVFHGGHTWPGHPIDVAFDLGLTSMDFDASAAIWEFFKAQSLPS
jgi:polyhydroxybutyrate depolymerase